MFYQFIEPLVLLFPDIPSWLTNFQVPINSWQGIEIHPHSINLRLRALIQRSQCSLLDFRSFQMYKTGIYRISQLSIETHKRLEFLSNAFQPKVLFEIKECMASVTVTPLSELVAGIQIPIEIKIDTGSSSLPKGSKLVLSSSPGLSFLLDEEDSPHPPLETQVTLSLSEDHLEAFSTSILRLIMIAELPHQKDNTKIDHSMWIKCPWSEEQNHVKFAFELPFACSCKLQTVNLRKFLQVNIQGYTRFNISLLSANLTCSETLKPVNVLFPISICENKTASLVWELLLNNAQEDTIKYSLDKYSVEDNKENENHPLNDIVKLSPSKSLKKRVESDSPTSEEQCFNLEFALNYSYENYSSRFACLYNISNYKIVLP
ncbi:trafficking protein particle complex subunit 10-like [Diaphorina citri]|uniref:Trafficking protein particle complex subunit 10-like n=1 Tax=Diaphorina citri TaxID=121845 RepID=A0A3Q0IN33_DIACI|nr:trafficking protein particle complex subunit 10-like [Diaphorina citri]